MANTPEFGQLEALAVFADHLNLTRAARVLHLSQPALHTRLRRLGEAVGAPLYRRDGRALVLTAAGIQTARFAREILARVSDFAEQMRDEQVRAPICLCAGEGALLYLLGPALRRFARRHPLRVPYLVATLVMFVGSVATGWHYAIDGYAGILLAWLVFRLALVTDRALLPEG